MEPVLTNTCEYSEEHLTEAMQSQMGKRQSGKSLLLCAAIGLLLIFSLYNWLIGGKSQYAFYALICAGSYILLLITNRSLPRRMAKLQAARLRERNSSLEFQSRFLEEGIVMRSPSGTEEDPIPYTRFARVVDTRRLILLLTDAKQMILLDPTRFEGGTEADFRRLMEEKCPRAVPLEKG